MKIKNEKIFTADIYSGDLLRGEKLHRHHVIMVKFTNLYVPVEPFIKNRFDYLLLSLYENDHDEETHEASINAPDYRFYSDKARRENLEGLCKLKNLAPYCPNNGKTSLKELHKAEIINRALLEHDMAQKQKIEQTAEK